MRRTHPGRERARCVKCFKNRPLKNVTGPGIPDGGLLLCRHCTQAYKMLVELRRKQADGSAKAAYERLAREASAAAARSAGTT